MKIYTVQIDSATGEWLSQAEPMSESTTREDWASRADTEQYHYDFTEIDGETVAILCEYVG